jgi:glycine/D-amino acid oxidase-like deaminating enzyme
MRARVVVIGGGAIGASCFYHLTERGQRDVLLVERAALGHGSTGRSAAVVETQYLDRDRIAVCAWSMRLFRRLEHEHGLPFAHHGYLRLGRTARDLMQFQGSVDMQRELGMTDAVVLDAPAIERRFPALQVGDAAGGLLGPTDGFIDAVRYCELLAELGRARGGRVLQGAPVRGIRVRSGKVTAVELDGEIVECEQVVNAAGAWARAVGRLCGVDLPIDGYRRQLVNLESATPFAAPVPMVIEYVPGVEEEGLYFRGDSPTRLIAGLHWEGYGQAESPSDPDRYRETCDGDYATRVGERLARRYRGAADLQVTGGWAGLYPLTPDSQPILGEVPEVEGLWNAIGGGGVGVQTSPAIGAIVTDLLTAGSTAVLGDLGPYRLQRFGLAGATGR